MPARNANSGLDIAIGWADGREMRGLNDKSPAAAG